MVTIISDRQHHKAYHLLLGILSDCEEYDDNLVQNYTGSTQNGTLCQVLYNCDTGELLVSYVVLGLVGGYLELLSNYK